MAKNFENISNIFINDTNLSKLNLHILRLSYLEEDISYFMKEITKDKVQEIAEKLNVSNFEEEKKR